MNYFFLLRQPLVANWMKFALFAGLSGVASASVLAVINQATVAASDGGGGGSSCSLPSSSAACPIAP